MATKPTPISSKAAKPALIKTAAPKVAKSPRPAAAAKSAVAKTPGAVRPAGAKSLAPAAVVSAGAKATDAGGSNANSLKKKDLIDRVLKVTGAKKKDVRDIVEATLNVLGDALSKGEMLNLPPFGKAKVSRPSETGSGKAMTVKLRRGPGNGAGGGKAKLTLADPEE
jgi:nucleoid DNA-binding protein